MKLNNVKYLSLPQQVEENRKQIQKLLTEYSQVFTTQIAIQGQTSILIANLTNIEHKPVVGDLIYGSDTYYAQITRVGESVVEFTVIGQLADLDALYDFIQDAFDDITTNIAFKNQSNVFTQPQQVPSAVAPQHAVNKLQVETMFEMFKQQLRGYNLAMPYLTGKEYLGDGVYRLYNANGITIDYDVYTGIWTINGINNSSSSLSLYLSTDSYRGIVTAQMIILNGTVSSSSDGWRFAGNIGDETRIRYDGIGGYVKTANKTENPNILLRAVIGQVFNNFQFKLQLERGTEATPYTVPGQIPQYKIVGEE